MSVGTRSAIVATFITTLIVPVVDSAHHLVGHAWRAGGSKQVSCTKGESVTIGGKTYACDTRIVNTVHLPVKVKLCPKNLWWRNGRCVTKSEARATATR